MLVITVGRVGIYIAERWGFFFTNRFADGTDESCDILPQVLICKEFYAAAEAARIPLCYVIVSKDWKIYVPTIHGVKVVK